MQIQPAFPPLLFGAALSLSSPPYAFPWFLQEQTRCATLAQSCQTFTLPMHATTQNKGLQEQWWATGALASAGAPL